LPDIDIAQVVSAFLILLVSLTVHEAAHAWSAHRLGDSTARTLGRLSLNPLVHMDLIGTVVFPLISLLTNLPLLGWAKPVPVNVGRLGGDWRQKYMLISAAGPLSNVLIAVVAAVGLQALLAVFDGGMQGGVSLIPLLVMAVRLNVLLAVFNMLPVPPLDGGNVLAGLLSGPAAEALDRMRPYGFVILYGLMFSGILWQLVSPPADLLMGWLL
jgi:Zn-dependent protease